MEIKVGEYFTLNEFVKSDTAVEKKIDNTPNEVEIENIKELVSNIFDPARKVLGSIIISSGFRSTALNKAIGGATNSQHTKGQAGDGKLGGGSKAENERLYNYIRDNCEYDQLINEYDFSWIHASYVKGNNRKQQIKIG